MRIPVFKPTIKRNHMDSVLSCMVSDQIAPGALSEMLAAEAARYVGLDGGVACAGYRAGLTLALESMGIERGDRVVISALSPEIYRSVLDDIGAEPLVVDVDPDSAAIRPDRVRERLAGGARAILLHYTLGFVPEMDELAALGVPIVEDLSQALGSSWAERRCGSFGELAVVSLGASGIVTAGEGALVLAGNRRRLRLLEEAARRAALPLSDLNASLGLAQLKEIESYIAVRRETSGVFSRSVMKCRHRTLVQRGEGGNVSYSFPVCLEQGLKEVRSYARKKNVDTLPAFGHTVAAGADDDGRFPEARELMLRCLLFPCYPMLGKRNVEAVARVLATLP